MSFRIAFGALWTAIRHPRVWLTAWAIVTVPALLALVGCWRALETQLARHPEVSLCLDLVLDVGWG